MICRFRRMIEFSVTMNAKGKMLGTKNDRPNIVQQEKL